MGGRQRDGGSILRPIGVGGAHIHVHGRPVSASCNCVAWIYVGCHSDKTNCCEDTSDTVYIERIVDPKLTSSVHMDGSIIHDRTKTKTKTMPGAYVPPNRRFRSRQSSSSLGATSALGIKWKPRFDLEKQASAFPSLPGAQTPNGDSVAPELQLAGFLEKAAQRTERIRRRGRRVAKPKCPIGWVKLPLPPRPDDPPPARPHSQRAYAEASWRILARIQRRRDAENEILGPHSQWADAADVHDPLTYEDDSDVEYWSGAETETDSENE